MMRRSLLSASRRDSCGHPPRLAIRSGAPLRDWRRCGISLIEAVLATLLVGLIIVGALRSLAGSLRTSHVTQQQIRARFLAEHLLIEATRMPWSDPDGSQTPASIGIDSDDPPSPVRRSQLDDMDDLHMWNEAPCRDADGNVLTGTHEFARTVTVQNASLMTPSSAIASTVNTGLRRITVTVSIASTGRILASITTLVSQAERQEPAETFDVATIPLH